MLRSQARHHIASAIYHNNHGNLLEAICDYAGAINSMNQLSEPERTNEDYWLQARNYLRLARGFSQLPNGQLAEQAYYQVLEWLMNTNDINPQHAGLFVAIFKELKNLYNEDTDEYHTFYAAEMLLSTPAFDAAAYSNQYLNTRPTTAYDNLFFNYRFVPLLFLLGIELQEKGLLHLNKRVDEWVSKHKDYCRGMAISGRALADMVVPGKELGTELNHWLSLSREEQVKMLEPHKKEEKRKSPDDMGSAAQNLLKLDAGVMTRSKTRKLNEEMANQQPSKRPG